MSRLGTLKGLLQEVGCLLFAEGHLCAFEKHRRYLLTAVLAAKDKRTFTRALHVRPGTYNISRVHPHFTTTDSDRDDSLQNGRFITVSNPALS